MSDSAISTPAQLGASWQGLQSRHPGNDEVRRLRVPSAGPWSYFTPKSQEGRDQDSEGAGLQIPQFTDLNSRSDEGGHRLRFYRQIELQGGSPSSLLHHHLFSPVSQHQHQH